MPTLQLTGGRTFHVADTLLDLPVEHLLAYQSAMSPENSIQEGYELQYQQQYRRPAATDELSQLAFAASLDVLEAAPRARAFTVLVTHIEQQPVTDFSAAALRERLGWLLACGLQDEQVQRQIDRHTRELHSLLAPFYQTVATTEARTVEVFEHSRRRAIALYDYALDAPIPALGTSIEVVRALFDVLEPSADTPEHAALCPIVRQRSFEQLSSLMLRNPRQCFVTKRRPASLTLSFFLDNVRQLIQLLPA